MVKKKAVTRQSEDRKGREKIAIRVYNELRRGGVPESTAQRAKMAAFENPTQFERQLIAMLSQTRGVPKRAHSLPVRTNHTSVRRAARTRRRPAA